MVDGGDCAVSNLTNRPSVIVVIMMVVVMVTVMVVIALFLTSPIDHLL